MILSGRDLRWYINAGKLKIEPVVLEQFQQNGVDCILERAEEQAPNFWLACTREIFQLPDDLMAFVGLRSTYARQGFSLPLTIVDAGFCGNLTLEILRFGIAPIPIGQPFAHLIFAKLTNPAEPYRGKYQGQRGITPAIEVLK